MLAPVARRVFESANVIFDDDIQSTDDEDVNLPMNGNTIVGKSIQSSVHPLAASGNPKVTLGCL